MFKTFLNKVRKEKKSLENKNKFLNADDNNNNDDDDDDNGYDEGCCHAERDKQAKDSEIKCQCPEPVLEPGFPRWWKKAPPPPAKPVKKKKEEEPPKKEESEERIQLKCRGANHIIGGPCVCESETRLREVEKGEVKNKDFFVYRGAREVQTPYAFVRADPGNGFPGNVGDAVHLLFKDDFKGVYECRLADGTERHATIPVEYLDVIVDVDNIIPGAR